MNDLNGAAGCPSAAILRKLAASSRSLAELEALLAAMPFSEVQQLLNDLADALDALKRPAAHGEVTAPQGGVPSSRHETGAGTAAPKAPRQDPKGPGRQVSFGFGSQAPDSALSAGPTSPHPSAAPAAKAPETSQPTAAPALETPPRKLILYSDGAARGNPGPSGAGAVLMLPDGKIVARLGKYLGIQTNNHAEYSAAILGLEAALKLGATEVEMVADSELLVKQVNGVYKVKNEHLKELWVRVRELMRRFDKATIRHVLRAYNQEADEMSNRAIDERM